MLLLESDNRGYLCLLTLLKYSILTVKDRFPIVKCKIGGLLSVTVETF